MIIEFKLSKGGQRPSYAHDGDAGLDVFAVVDDADGKIVIMPGAMAKIRLGVHMAIPDRCVGLLMDRSSIANKALTIIGGVIDAGYRGEISAMLVNLGNEMQTIKDGAKIAQLVIVPCVRAQLVEVKELDQTTRGENGYGSTGDR